MISKILIANRGEIAVRIIRTCKEMGIRTVAVYSTADRDALHVQLAHESVCIGGPRPAESYLNMNALIQAACSTGCDAIHPGFGFLSENPQFARLVEQCGLIFIGPKADVIEKLGNKSMARQMMQEAGVPVVPGSKQIIATVEEGRQLAEQITYPLIIKAANGGGGRGMRIVRSEDELENAFYSAKSEAKACFGDDDVYMEKYIEHPKHVEVQVLADEFGNVVHLYERDCSFQRRNQKMIEEAPCHVLRDDVRERAEKTLAERSAAAPEQGDTFAIYQLKGGPETRDYRFEAYESLQEAGLAVDRQNYDLVYTAPLDGKTTLEDIYRTFNLNRPADFTGHSLSVSDVVVLNRSGKEEAHYCDSFGFTPVPEFFLQREKQLTPRELLTGESIQTPRGSFLVTDMSREQLEAAGYGFHHQSEDGKYLIMGNGTDAFAIPAQQESPIKAAEMTTEQNYNMIDGVLNNAPTMGELEARVKAGEQVSLLDVAQAAKAEAQKPKQPSRSAKTAQRQKKLSIRAQLAAAKEEQGKKPPAREKSKELEV